jgi:hypothetical protein
MFLHFIIAGIMLVFLMFSYSDSMLHQSIKGDLVVLFLMIVCWGLLYFIGRQTRANGYLQMEELEQEFNSIIR